MSRYIDAEKLVERIKASPAFPNMGEDGYFLRGCVCDLIEMQPTADVAPVRHGRIVQTIENGHMKRVFSCCGTDFTKLTMWMAPDFCPNCGAKMDGNECEA